MHYTSGGFLEPASGGSARRFVNSCKEWFLPTCGHAITRFLSASTADEDLDVGFLLLLVFFVGKFFFQNQPTCRLFGSF